MILKAIIIKHDGIEVTHYYDNVEHAMFYYNEEVARTCVSLSFSGAREDTILAINKEAYLYDSNGETIKKFIA